MEILVILVLLLFNGLFSMFEMALVSSRKSRLEEKSKFGSTGAKIALEFLDEPEKILSAIQVGITLIGIVTGAFGGVALAEDVAPFFLKVPFLALYANTIAVILVVGFITYLSLIIGELVPKTLALNNPEKITILFSPFMKVVGQISYPIVWFLSISTKLILKVMGIKEKDEAPVTEEELRILLKQGSENGVIEKEESEIIREVMRFGDKRAVHIMIQRTYVEWLDCNSSPADIVKEVVHSGYTRIPVCNKSINDVVGVVNVKDILTAYIDNPQFDILQLINEPLFIPEQIPATKVLEMFRKTKNHFGVVVDEYGGVSGIITLHDVTENIIGDLPELDDSDEPEVVEREDGSYLIDGSMMLDDLKDLLGLYSLNKPHEDPVEFNTVGGLTMYKLNKIPHTGDSFIVGNFRFEVLDMDGNRVDKVLVSDLDK